MHVKDLAKMPKRKVTVDDLLHLDGINEVLSYLQDKKHEISNMVLWVQWRDGDHGQWVTSWATSKEILWLLEQIKYRLLQKAMEVDDG